MGVEEVLKWFLWSISSWSSEPVQQSVSYWHCSHLFKRPLPPCTIDQSLSTGLEFLGEMRCRCRLIDHSAGQLKQTGRAMERNATVIFDIQPFKFPREILRVIILRLNSAASARAGLCHGGRGATLASLRLRPLATELGQGIFQLCNSRLQLFGI